MRAALDAAHIQLLDAASEPYQIGDRPDIPMKTKKAPEPEPATIAATNGTTNGALGKRKRPAGEADFEDQNQKKKGKMPHAHNVIVLDDDDVKPILIED